MENNSWLEKNPDLFELFSNMLKDEYEIDILNAILSERDENDIFEFFLEKIKRGEND